MSTAAATTAVVPFSRASFARLVALAAIWGSSFLFLRQTAPVFGPVWTAALRLALAGSVLCGYLAAVGRPVRWRGYVRHYFWVGVINSSIPFCLFAFAALALPASYSVVLNSSTPLFGAVFASLVLGDRLSWIRLLGLALGSLGVAVVTGLGSIDVTPLVLVSMGACLVAAACYAAAGIYLKRWAPPMDPPALAGASQVLAALALVPLLGWSELRSAPTLPAVASLVTLSLLCSGVAYLLYFRLIADVGPMRAQTVTFLMPVFGVLWGAIFLGESLSIGVVGGCALIVSGTALVLRGDAWLSSWRVSSALSKR